MDTQGYDLEVVKGAQGCIERILAIQSELSIEPIYEGMPDFLSALYIYKLLGFNLIGFHDISRNPETGSIVEANCILARSSIHFH